MRAGGLPVARFFRMKRNRGFTLLEIMLVLLLLALGAVAVIATLPDTHNDEAREFAQKLYQRLQLVNEEALLSGRDYGLLIDEKQSKVSFLAMGEKGWAKMKSDRLKSELVLPDDLDMEYTPGDNVWQDKDRLFNPGTLFDEEMFAEEKSGDKQKPPQVFILSSGEVTPFLLSIHPAHLSKDEGWRIAARDNGEIQLLAPGEENEK